MEGQHYVAEEEYSQLLAHTSNSPMRQFYAGTHVFITGGTGFMGKVLTEKLLRCFPELDTIYLLMREKRGKSIEERMDDMFDEPLFCKLRQVLPGYRAKVRAVEGDCARPGLGLSDADTHLLLHSTDIVIHGAATVRFDEKLRLAVGINVCGTKAVIDLAKQMDKLKAMVHVSTAYCNCPMSYIDEIFYAPAMPYQQLTGMVETCPDGVLESASTIILDKWPNTYTLTKAVAEDVIRQDGPGLPIVVFRPSVVVSTLEDPIPGWIDNIYGPTGVVIGAGTGVLKTLNLDTRSTADLVPVDMAINAILAAAWDVGTNRRPATADEIPIYNYVSSNERRLTWENVTHYVEKYGVHVPSVHAIWYYSYTTNKNYYIHCLYSVLLQYLPALVLDAMARVMGKEARLWDIYRKIDKHGAAIRYFNMHSWSFCDDNVQALWRKLSDQDRRAFKFSMGQVDWDTFFYHYIRGCRVYILKDDMSTLPQAMVRWRRFYWLHQGLKIIGLLILLRMSWFVLSCVYQLIASSGVSVVMATSQAAMI